MKTLYNIDHPKSQSRYSCFGVMVLILFLLQAPLFSANKSSSVTFAPFRNNQGQDANYSTLITKLASRRLSADPSFTTNITDHKLSVSEINNRNASAFAALCLKTDSRYVITGTYTVEHIPGKLSLTTIIYDDKSGIFSEADLLHTESGARLVADTEALAALLHSTLSQKTDRISTYQKPKIDYSSFNGFTSGMNTGYTFLLTYWGRTYDDTVVYMPYVGYELKTASNTPFLSLKAEALLFNSQSDDNSNIDYNQHYSFFEGYGSSADLFATFGNYFRAGINAGGGFSIFRRKYETSEDEGLPQNKTLEENSGYIKGGLFLETIPSALKLTFGISFLHSFHEENADLFIFYGGAGIRF
jgi:hypothetical protein